MTSLCQVDRKKKKIQPGQATVPAVVSGPNASLKSSSVSHHFTLHVSYLTCPPALLDALRVACTLGLVCHILVLLIPTPWCVQPQDNRRPMWLSASLQCLAQDLSVR